MLAKLKTFSLVGIEAVPVDVEVDLSPSPLPKTVLVGLPEQAVRESTHRVERALVNSGFVRPHDRVVINLAPAELPKQASSFDLPISLGVLVGSGQFSSELLEQYAVVGELALEGQARPVKGALSMAMTAAKQAGLKGFWYRVRMRLKPRWSSKSMSSRSRAYPRPSVFSPVPSPLRPPLLGWTSYSIPTVDMNSISRCAWSTDGKACAGFGGGGFA